MPNEVTPVINIQSSSPYHSVSYVDVLISANPDDREVYKQGSVKVGDRWEPTWSLSYVALSKLMNAAGIEEVANRRVDDRSHPFVCAWQFSAKWTQPDSTVLSYSGDYELDLRDWIDVGGGQRVKAARFEKSVIDERERVIEERYKKEIGSDWKNKSAKCDQIYSGLSEDVRREIDDIAEAKALRFVVQMRQFIVQRTQTGAMERAIRKMLNLKSQYTTAELKQPFRVPRSRFDWDRVDKVLGATQTMELRRAQALQLLGLTAADIQQARQLEAPRTEWKEVVASDGTPMAVADITVTVPPDVAESDIRAAASVVDAVASAIDVKGRDEQGRDDDGGFDLKPDEMVFRGKVVKKDEVIGAALQEPETKQWFTQKVVGSFQAPQHYKAHLKKHFQRESAVNLTYYEIDLLARHQINGAEYPEKYAGPVAEKKEPKPDKKSVKKKAADSGEIKNFVTKICDAVCVELKLGADRESDVESAVRDVVGAVETGVIANYQSSEGIGEIESFLREQLKR